MAAREVADVILRDQGSTNGSFIQGSRFKEITIGYGAEVKVGRTLLKYLPHEEAVEPEVSDMDAFGSLVGRNLKMKRLFKLLEDVRSEERRVGKEWRSARVAVE